MLYSVAKDSQPHHQQKSLHSALRYRPVILHPLVIPKRLLAGRLPTLSLIHTFALEPRNRTASRCAAVFGLAPSADLSKTPVQLCRRCHRHSAKCRKCTIYGERVPRPCLPGHRCAMLQYSTVCHVSRTCAGLDLHSCIL